MDYIKCKVMVPYKDGKMTSYIIDSSTVLETEYTNEGTLFSIECSKEDYVKYQSYIIQSDSRYLYKQCINERGCRIPIENCSCDSLFYI